MLDARAEPGMIAGVKRKVALAVLAALVLSIGAGALVLRTSWAARTACAVAESRLRHASGLELALGTCRFEPLALQVTVSDVRLGSRDAPVFTADSVRARLSALQLHGHQLELAEVEVVHPRVVATLPPRAPGTPPPVCPPPMLQHFGVHRLRVHGGAVDLTLPGGERLVVDRVEVSTSLSRRRGLRALANVVGRNAAIDVSLSGAHLQARGRRVDAREVRIDTDVALDLSRAYVHLARAELPGATVVAAGSIEQLCQPRLDLAASLEGDLPSLLTLLGSSSIPAEGRLAVDVNVSGAANAPVVEGDVRLSRAVVDGWRPGDVAARVRLAGSELRLDQLDVPMLGGRIAAHGVVRLEQQVKLDMQAAIQNVELAEIFGRLKLPGAWVMARVDGIAHVSGTAWPLQLGGDAGLDITAFRVLDHSWERYRPGESTYLDLPRARVDGSVRIDTSGVRITSARVRAGEGTLVTSAMLHFDMQRGFEIGCEGGVDLGQLRHLGPVPIAGVGRLERGFVRAAPYGNPHVEGHLALHDVRFLQLDLGELTTSLSYDDFVLRLSGVDGRRGATRYQGDGDIDLDESPPRLTEARYSAQGRLRDLFEATMPWQPNAVHARDTLDGNVILHGTARGPVTALQARVEGELGGGELAGRAFDAGRFVVRVEDGATASFETVELRHASGAVHASGRVGFKAPFPWDIDASFSTVPLADLALPGAAWAGTVSGKASIHGSYANPRAELKATAAGVAVSRAPIGNVDVDATLAGTSLNVKAAARGVSVTGSARTAGDAPFEARASLDLEDVLQFVPGGPPAGLHAAVRGTATASGTLRDPAAARAELRLDQVRAGYGEFKVENAAPVVISAQERRVDVRAFTMRGPSTELSVTGAREPSGALSLDANGALDLRLFGGVVPGISDPRGQMHVEAHVGGTLSDPLLVGSGKLRDARFQMRDLPIVLSGMNGELAFSQNRILFDRLSASVNGGHAELDGELQLVHLLPARVRVGAVVDEVPVRIPEWLPSVVSGRLQAAGTWDAMVVSGKLHVVRALYSEPVDLEKRLVEVQRRRPEAKPFDRSGEWLAFDIGLAVDGDVRIENDLVRGGVQGDLTLTGTLASVGMLGSLTMTPGSRGTFRGNEFAITHAVVDFTERRKLRMNLDVHGNAQVHEYQIFMHVYGPYEDPALQLTSQPALSQQDVVTLLSLGYTTRDTAAVAGMSGVATAAAAQALFTASGLDDQVRRFAPRGGVLRDFAVRFTSVYSEGAGQVLPSAEFESKVLDDRFRLRYQAPLAGARGQRAQAEMRLGAHTSLQYQWDNDNPEVTSGGDHGIDLKLRWEWTD